MLMKMSLKYSLCSVLVGILITFDELAGSTSSLVFPRLKTIDMSFLASAFSTKRAKFGSSVLLLKVYDSINECVLFFLVIMYTLLFTHTPVTSFFSPSSGDHSLRDNPSIHCTETVRKIRGKIMLKTVASFFLSKYLSTVESICW